MKKKLLIIITFGVFLFLLLPISNLLVHPSITVLSNTSQGPEATAVAHIFDAKCAFCHVPNVELPFYAKLPVASSLMQSDIAAGIKAMNFEKELFTPGKVPPGPVLAKIERELKSGDMPPLQFLALHWKGSLTTAERDAVFTWIAGLRSKSAPPGTPPAVAAGPVHPLPLFVDVDARKVALGQRLYNDKRLSADNTIACATCHDLNKGGTDQDKVSTGIRGQKGGINAPTTFNSGFQFMHFWDGRAATLQAQAGGPPQNPIEMGSNWNEISDKLGQDEAFAKEFKSVYADGLSEKNITDAIAEYERTLITPNSRFDKFLMGQGDLTAEEKHGWQLFQEKGCTTCHTGKLLGGESFELLGREDDYFATRGNLTDADNGRWNVTKQESDRHKFKVPTLRNIARTAPYFHDGSAATLGAAVQTMAHFQLGENLSESERDAVVKFLETLTGEFEGKPL